MFLLAHMGITVGVAQGGALLWNRSKSKALKPRLIFILAAGAIFPDVIDKPLGHLFFPQTLGTGRAFAHTLCFFLLLFSFSFLSQKRNLLYFSLAHGTHLLLDGLPATPEILFWPLYGWIFPASNFPNFSSWVRAMLLSLSQPKVYSPEILGFFLILLSFYLYYREVQQTVLWRKRKGSF